jgi:hypothetical protein
VLITHFIKRLYQIKNRFSFQVSPLVISLRLESGYFHKVFYLPVSNSVLTNEVDRDREIIVSIFTDDLSNHYLAIFSYISQ